MTPEARAREQIDSLLAQAGWHLCGTQDANLHAARGVAIREFPLNPGHGSADYLLYVDGKACGVVEAKKSGSTLTGVEPQSAGYAQGLPASLPAWHRPLPFLYESTGSGKTFTAIGLIYRLIKFAGARRVLFLVNRGNLGRQTKREFDAYASPYNNFKFGEEYIVQHLQNNQLDKSARVCRSHVQQVKE